MSDRNAILAYKKNKRKCGISITNFILNESMQMDETIKGITLQLSGTHAPAAEQEESTQEAGEALIDAAQ